MANPLEHVVVVMLENRSFDHMVGFLRSPDYPINGLKGTEAIPEDPAEIPPKLVEVRNDADYTGDLDKDPGHGFANVSVQLFGHRDPSTAKPTNDGFVLDYRQITGPAGPFKNIMRCFDPAKLPVLTTLAREFAICDNWFSSVPSLTWPNRLFVHAATSDGEVRNDVRFYRVPTITKRLLDARRSCRIYYHDMPQSLAFLGVAGGLTKGVFRKFDRFGEDVASGELPSYSFIEPRYFNFLRKRANDQHPPHDVRLGEELIADIYETLRNSPFWERSLLVVLYDEHGGLYDHQAPPTCESPDGKNSSDPFFDFTRLGPRVPAVLVSPRIEKGTIVSEVLEHASVPATLRAVFGLPDSLTARDAAANTFENVVKPGVLRDDTPVRLERPEPRPDGEDRIIRIESVRDIREAFALGMESTDPLSEFQETLVELANQLPIDEPAEFRMLRMARPIRTEHDGALYVREATERFLRQ